MKKEAINKTKKIRLVIEYDEPVGFYLFVYDLDSGKCLKDHLYSPNQLDDLYFKAHNDYEIEAESFYSIK